MKPPTPEELEEDKEEDQIDAESEAKKAEEFIPPTHPAHPHQPNNGGQPDSNPNNDANDHNRENKPICPQYKYGRCPNYETCQLTYYHPRRCRNMLSLGKCRFGDKCRFYHPKICFNSMKDRKCTNLECRFFHLKYTRRYEEALSNQLHSEHHGQQPSSQDHATQSNYHQSYQPQPVQPSFLSEHIKETNNTLKQLQTLISNLITNQNRQEQQNHYEQEFPYPSQNHHQVTHLTYPH